MYMATWSGLHIQLFHKYITGTQVREGQADHRGVSNVAGKLGKGSSNQTVATL